jgi:hypothetical protein
MPHPHSHHPPRSLAGEFCTTGIGLALNGLKIIYPLQHSGKFPAQVLVGRSAFEQRRDVTLTFISVFSDELR